MAKSKSPPQIPDRFDLLMKLAPLCMDLYHLMRTSNDLDDIDPVSATILATVTVGNSDGQPMTADDIAFFHGIPLRTVKSKLKQLVKIGIIEPDGKLYRYIQPRELTADEMRRIKSIQRRFNELTPALSKLYRLPN
jgi:hypothetical protein